MAIVKGTLNSETLNAADGVTNGADGIFGFTGNDIIYGLGGDDTIYGGGGDDTLYGGSENDKLFGQGDTDTLEGGDGDDMLDGGSGIDNMDGGDGNDTYIVDSFWDKVYEGRYGGNDTVKAGVSYDLAFADADYVETLRTTDDDGLAHTNLYGSNIANTLIGNAGVNILDGRANADIMSGLAGNDIYFVDKLGDIVFEAAGQGGDTVRAWSTYGLVGGQEVEALTTTDNNGGLKMNLNGNDFTQVIVGNAAVNVLRGFDGGDQLQGMAGHDTLVGGDRERQVPVQHRAQRRHQRRHHHRHDGGYRHHPARRCALRRDWCRGRAERRCLPHRRGGCRRRGPHRL